MKLLQLTSTRKRELIVQKRCSVCHIDSIENTESITDSKNKKTSMWTVFVTVLLTLAWQLVSGCFFFF